jgi:RNA polymerase sigma-70 factor (ECF subfamily)
MTSSFAHLASFTNPVLINGAAGVLVVPDGKPFAVNAFTVVDGQITAIHVLADQARISRLDLPPIRN